MNPCCGFGKVVYFMAMLVSCCLAVAALTTPRWLKVVSYQGENYLALLDCDTYISGTVKATTFFSGICWALFADCLAFFNCVAFGLACSRPTQCYLAMRRSAIISCYVFSQFSVILIAFPIEASSSQANLGISYYLLVGATFSALIAIVCGFVTSQIMYNALKRDWNHRYTLSSLCLPF